MDAEEESRKRARIEANIPEIFDLENVVGDPGLRRPIEEFGTPEIRDKMRWAYLSRGRNRLIGHNFPKGPDRRSFLDAWYAKHDWLEYSVEKKAAFCFHCFLFKSSSNSNHFGYDVFTKKGFSNWKKASEIFKTHIGGPSSIHNNARNSCEDFRNKKQSVAYAIVSHEEQSHIKYEIRLRAVLGVVRFLLEQGLAFRGHDESSTSLNKGNFRELLDWYGARCKDVADVINENAPGNCQLTSPEIQKDIVQACAEEITQVIMSELGNSGFSLLVDESRDVSVKEQMAVMVRFLNQKGKIMERLLGVDHVLDTRSASLKSNLDAMFLKHNLSMSRLRGQGYDGASNMRGELHGLKTLILADNPHAFYVHCFAHQLQLVVVAVVKNVLPVGQFFGHLNKIVLMVSSCTQLEQDCSKKNLELIFDPPQFNSWLRHWGHRTLLPLPAAPQFVARFRSNGRLRLTPAGAAVHASRIPPTEARCFRVLSGSRHCAPPLHRIRSGTPCCAYVEKMLVPETGSLLDVHQKEREARIRNQLHKVELPPSPYDTAWVAMVPLRGSPHTPCFPQCVEWILQNQHENGSWDINEFGSSANKNVLLSTLACVLALEKWNVGQEHIRRGLHFIGRNFSLVMDEEITAPTGFNMIFPGMLSLAIGVGLQFPVRQTDIDGILHQWEMELKRSVDGKILAGEKSYGREAYMAYVAEGLGNLLDWNEVMKFQRKNGSLFNSPSTTAAALVHNYDDKALEYLNMLVSKFGGAVPTVYPLNMHCKLSMVDSLEKIGISRHFSSEIEEILDMAYSFWLQRDEEIMMDVATCAMAFRLLRMNGYDVSSDELSHLAEASNFHNSLQGYLNDAKSVLELYKASKVSVSEHELILDNIGNWSGNLLSEKLCSEGVQGLPIFGEMEYALKFPFYTTLERLGHKRNIEHFDARGSHILKTEYLPYGINQELLALAIEDFTFSQSIYQDELLHLDRWVKENRLDQLQFARQKLTYCYLSAAATIFPPELSDARISWAKNGVLTTVVDDFFDVGGSKEELENLMALVEKWDEHHEDDIYSEQVKIVFCALYTTVNQLGSIASAVQNRDVKNHLIEIWLHLLRSMMTEAEWQRSQYVPTMEEYMTNGVVSFALGPIVLPALYCVGEKLLGSAVKNQEYSELFRLMSTCGRLLNDSQGFEREGSEGKLNSVSLLVLHSGGSLSVEAAKNAIQKSIVASRRDLLRLVLKEGTAVPRACKELFWKMCKILHLFYFRTDGFSSPKEMASAVNAVINEPLRLSS